jgi:hypothetical protein
MPYSSPVARISAEASAARRPHHGTGARGRAEIGPREGEPQLQGERIVIGMYVVERRHDDQRLGKQLNRLVACREQRLGPTAARSAVRQRERRDCRSGGRNG